MICKECGSTKSRVENQYNLGCEVKNQTDLLSSLAKLIDKEEIQDYQCEACNQRVDVEKRTLLADTPNVLFVHLQRIVFDFETMDEIKINTKLEFPKVLDLKPYTVKGIAEQ